MGGYAAFALAVVASSGYQGIGVPRDATGVDWVKSGLEYVSYNAVALPACLYSFNMLDSRGRTAASAVGAALLVVVPMALVSVAIAAGPAGILDSPVPLHDVVASLGTGWLLVLYYLILVWTLFDTAVGLVYAIVERIDGHVLEVAKRKLVTWQRGAITAGFLGLAVLLARVGIIDLVARGYSAMAYGFLAVLVVPMLTVGVYKLRRGA